MHELSIATGLLDRALTAAREHDATRIDELTVEVGQATHVNPDQLRFCLETAATDTPADDATVTIETVPAAARCACGWTGTPESLDVALSYAPDVRCPDCGERADLERGRGCRLASIEIPDRVDGEGDTHPADERSDARPSDTEDSARQSGNDHLTATGREK